MVQTSTLKPLLAAKLRLWLLWKSLEASVYLCPSFLFFIHLHPTLNHTSSAIWGWKPDENGR
jgi:hypothetical protein